MTDEKPADGSVSVNVTVKQIVAIVLALAGVQFGASRLSIGEVGETAEKAVKQAGENQADLVRTMEAIRVGQESARDTLQQFMGEVRWRLKNLEDSQSENQGQLRELRTLVDKRAK